ncbi:protein SpAN-like [Amphiura filiformis]|uniref:protein SpAN-like n=1 Tax=Amphiura filiformis TaxID=82378 RepID=UPI003B21DF54
MRLLVFSMVLAIFSMANASPVPKGKFQDPFNKKELLEETVSPEMFQGDMKLTSKQRIEIEEAMKLQLNGMELNKRKAWKMLHYRWPHATVYYSTSDLPVEDPYNANAVHGIYSAINHWEEHTCIRFIKGLNTDFINFKKGNGCWSNVGRINGSQDISIGDGCTYFSIIVHEIGHALGFHHEQSRPDRDDYVKVHNENISPGMEYNFNKYDWFHIVTHEIPYDYNSVMHYGPYAFAINPLIPTITPIPDSPRYHEHFFQMEDRFNGLSFADVKLANNIYSCGEFGDDCDEVSIKCQHGGYLGPRCTCVCPPGHSGTMCEV